MAGAQQRAAGVARPCGQSGRGAATRPESPTGIRPESPTGTRPESPHVPGPRATGHAAQARPHRRSLADRRRGSDSRDAIAPFRTTRRGPTVRHTAAPCAVATDARVTGLHLTHGPDRDRRHSRTSRPLRQVGDPNVHLVQVWRSGARATAIRRQFSAPATANSAAPASMGAPCQSDRPVQAEQPGSLGTQVARLTAGTVRTTRSDV